MENSPQLPDSWRPVAEELGYKLCSNGDGTTMPRARRILVIVGIGAFLISADLLALRSLKQSLDGFARSTGTLFQRLNAAVGVVSAASKSQPSVSGNFHWNWRDQQELKANESVRNTKLTSKQRKEISDAIAEQIRPMMADVGIESEAKLQEAALNTRIRMIDLNGDGSPEVVAQGMTGCGATGNCPFWVLQKSKSGYAGLLDGAAQTFTIQGSSTNGFHDIVLSTHGSYSSGSLTIYQYRQRVYRDVGSYCYEWTALEGEKVRELKEPRIHPCGID